MPVLGENILEKLGTLNKQQGLRFEDTEGLHFK